MGSGIRTVSISQFKAAFNTKLSDQQNPLQTAILQPRKQPRGGELSYADKVRNRLISSIRVRVEHTIGSVKRYRIAKDKLRNWKPGFRDLMFEVCCGLHNFRMNFRPWHYKPVTYIEHLLKY